VNVRRGTHLMTDFSLPWGCVFLGGVLVTCVLVTKYIFNPEEGGSTFLGNVCIHVQDNEFSQPRRPQSDLHEIISCL
jgi:hypothetical protein